MSGYFMVQRLVNLASKTALRECHSNKYAMFSVGGSFAPEIAPEWIKLLVAPLQKLSAERTILCCLYGCSSHPLECAPHVSIRMHKFNFVILCYGELSLVRRISDPPDMEGPS